MATLMEIFEIKRVINDLISIVCMIGIRSHFKLNHKHDIFINKDHVSALLATRLEADTYVISTSVPEVYVNFGKPDQKSIRSATLEEMERFVYQGEFAAGSMLPKIRASIGFLKHGGERVVISSPGNLLQALDGEAGTTIVHGGSSIQKSMLLSGSES